MLAVGCLIPFVMLAVGAVLGSYLDAVHAGTGELTSAFARAS